MLDETWTRFLQDCIKYWAIDIFWILSQSLFFFLCFTCMIYLNICWNGKKGEAISYFINWKGWRLLHKGEIYGLQSFSLFLLKMDHCTDRDLEELERWQNWKTCDSSPSSQDSVSEVNDFCIIQRNTPRGCDKNVKINILYRPADPVKPFIPCVMTDSHLKTEFPLPLQDHGHLLSLLGFPWFLQA